MNPGLFKMFWQNEFRNHIFNKDLALNNLQWLICHKTKPNQILYIQHT